MTINPYLNFPGNSEEAFNFYRSVFGGEFPFVQRFKDTPEAGKISPEDLNKIMHISLPVGKGNMIMATDALESMGQKLTPGNNFYLCISADSKEEADKEKKSLIKRHDLKRVVGFWGNPLTRVELSTNY